MKPVRKNRAGEGADGGTANRKQRALRAVLTCPAAAAAWLCLSAPSNAQTGDLTALGQNVPPGAVAEVVVTAQKRAEKVQDVPKAVEVINQDALLQAGVANLQDIGLVSASVQGTSETRFSPPAIRGISSFALSIGVQTQTGVVLDDVPQPSFSTLANELADIEQVEILPGPQSTLSGRNAAGGLINIVTHSPSSTPRASLSVEQTSDRQTRIAGFVSGPIARTLAFSLSAYWDRWDGPYINAGEAGAHLGGFDQRGVRGKLRWRPHDGFTATLTGVYTKADFATPALLDGYPYIATGPGAGSIFAPGATFQQLYPLEPVGPYNRIVDSTTHSVAANENKGVSLRLDDDLRIGLLSSITSYSKGDQPSTDLLLAFPFFGANAYAQSNTDVTYTTQEFRLASPAGSGRLQYLLGLIYTDTDNFEPYVRQVFIPVDWNRDAFIQSLAVYGRATYRVLADTSLTLGLRYQYDHQGYGFVFADGTAPDSRNTSNYDFVTGEASLQHAFTGDIKGYLTYANAQTGRAYDLEDNGDAAAPAGLQPIASEKVHSLEAGLKTQWLDHRLTVNLSIFAANYRNYQVQAVQQTNFSLSVAPTVRLYAIGRVEDKGAELEASFAATRELRLGLSATYLDARILSYPNAQCHVDQVQGCVPLDPGSPGSPMVQPNLKGPLPGTSKFRGVASANYVLPLPARPFDGIFGVFYRYQTRTYFDLLGSPVDTQGGFGILNLSAGIRDHSGRWTLEGFVNNVGDKRYYSDVIQNPLSPGLAVESAYARDSFRFAGVRLNVNF